MSMKALLDHILDTSETPGMATVLVAFRSPAPIAKGALRRFEKVEGVYELLTVAQETANSQPFPLTHFFEAGEVARVMAPGSPDALPKIVAPPGAGGGLIIPAS